VIDTAIASSFDIKFTLGILLDQVTKQLGIETTNIMIFNPITQTIQSSVAQGFHAKRLGQASSRLGENYARQVIRERRTISIEDLTVAKEEMPGALDLVRAGITAYLGVPLVAKGLVKGVLEIYQGGPISLDHEQRTFLDMLAGQAAIAIDSSQLFENLQGSNVELMMAYDETIEGWSQAMDLRDKETEGHSRRVTEMTVKLASSFGSSPDELIHIRRGALLHDIGKLGVPDEILRKPGPLTDEEWVIMRKHPISAYEMLAPITYLHPAIDIPYCHHEKWDGSGYPRGLKGNQIPLAARIFAVADVWDALTSDRPYRKAWSKEKALEFIQEQSGKHFDPGVVSVFVRETSSQR
jgi:HD-GYP domain-containing protein (c-di-GMP phosphodiesterase class II)